MHISTLTFLGLAVIVPIQAFTNGSLIPAYFCNPVPDGMPKSLGQLIPFTVLDKNADLAFNANREVPNSSVLQNNPLMNHRSGK